MGDFIEDGGSGFYRRLRNVVLWKDEMGRGFM